jgi:hypothetical protein
MKYIIHYPRDLHNFIDWVQKNSNNERRKSLMILLAEHEKEKDEEEKQNIRRTLMEILENKNIWSL